MRYQHQKHNDTSAAGVSFNSSGADHVVTFYKSFTGPTGTGAAASGIE